MPIGFPFGDGGGGALGPLELWGFSGVPRIGGTSYVTDGPQGNIAGAYNSDDIFIIGGQANNNTVLKYNVLSGQMPVRVANDTGRNFVGSSTNVPKCFVISEGALAGTFVTQMANEGTLESRVGVIAPDNTFSMNTIPLSQVNGSLTSLSYGRYTNEILAIGNNTAAQRTVWSSVDALNWTVVRSGNAVIPVLNTIAQLPNGSWIGITTSGGLWRSNNGGFGWIDLTNGVNGYGGLLILPSGRIIATAANILGTGNLIAYADNSGGGGLIPVPTPADIFPFGANLAVTCAGYDESRDICFGAICPGGVMISRTQGLTWEFVETTVTRSEFRATAAVEKGNGNGIVTLSGRCFTWSPRSSLNRIMTNLS